MKTYKYKNATVYVNGEVNKERLRKSTIRFFKKAYECKKIKGDKNVNYNNSRDI